MRLSFVSAMLVSSLGIAACGPMVDSAAKADLDRQLAQIKTSEETYPPAESFLPMAFVVGQWTEHRITDERGVTALVTYKLVGQQDGAFWLETVSESYQGRDVTKMLVALTAGRDPAGMEIRALRIKKGKEAPVDVGADALTTVREQYRSSLDLLATSFDTDQKDDVRVPAGHFIGCYKVQTAGPWGPWHTPSVVCSHPSVPLSGVVRAHVAGNKARVMDLVGFGLTGAESEL
jgi:hypothetical protein